MRDLRRALSSLSDKSGVDFTTVIDRLDDEIAEREDRPSFAEGGDFDYRSSLVEPDVSDEEVREMFQTLRDL
jgi:hypothetical protein